jgi:DNA-binding TFAR19-related protein (PDSD5 family)
VKDYQAAFEKLRKDAAEAALIRDLATVPAKRELFDRLGLHLTSLADQVELAMIEASKSGRQADP